MFFYFNIFNLICLIFSIFLYFIHNFYILFYDIFLPNIYNIYIIIKRTNILSKTDSICMNNVGYITL